MVNEFFVVHQVVDYEGHYHLSIHVTYALALGKAKQLLATEVCAGSEHVYITHGEVGDDLTDLTNAEEIFPS